MRVPCCWAGACARARTHLPSVPSASIHLAGPSWLLQILCTKAGKCAQKCHPVSMADLLCLWL